MTILSIALENAVASALGSVVLGASSGVLSSTRSVCVDLGCVVTSLGTIKASDKPLELGSLGQESENSIQVGLCRVIR